MEAPLATEPPASLRILAEGADWRAVEVTCRAGPTDRPYEEQHDWTTVAAVLDGTFTYRSHRGRSLMSPGSLLLGQGGTCFECGHEHGTGDRCIAFQFAPVVIEEMAESLASVGEGGFRNPAIPPVEALLPLLAGARALAASPEPLQAEELALRLAGVAIRLDWDTAEAARDPRDEARAARAIRIIEARYAEPLTIAGLAREVGLRRRRFASMFRNLVGVTPYNYILNRRLDAAAARLIAEPAPVLEIALDAGMGDLSEFTRRFAARFGQPPAAYRRARRRR